MSVDDSGVVRLRVAAAEELEAARKYAAPEEPATRIPTSLVTLLGLVAVCIAYLFGSAVSVGRYEEKIDAQAREAREKFDSLLAVVEDIREIQRENFKENSKSMREITGDIADVNGELSGLEEKMAGIEKELAYYRARYEEQKKDLFTLSGQLNEARINFESRLITLEKEHE